MVVFNRNSEKRSGMSLSKCSNTNLPTYQIDFAKSSKGKQISKTKRRISWKFGFMNEDAISAGRSGVECRGEEYEVTLIWSITSGKRVVLFNGDEVHYSLRPREGKFQYQWTMKGGHTIKIVGHALALNKRHNWRQFDLLIDGLSYFDFRKIYELGAYEDSSSSANVPNINNRIESYGDVLVNEDSDDIFETQDMVLYKKDETKTTEMVDLLDMKMELNAKTDVSQNIVMFKPQQNVSSISNSFIPSDSLNVLPRNSYENTSKDIMMNINMIQHNERYSTVPSTSEPPSIEIVSTSSLSISEENESHGKYHVERALKKLVNFDDITSAPDSNQVQTLKPPVLDSWYRPQASLGEMQASKRTSTIKNEVVIGSKPTPTEEVYPGTMVLCGTQAGSYGNWNNHLY